MKNETFSIMEKISLETLNTFFENLYHSFVFQYNLVEQIFVVVIGLLIAYLGVALLIGIIKLLLGLKSFLVPKGMGRQLKVSKNGNLVDSGAKNKIREQKRENVGFLDSIKLLNKARKLAIIERELKKDKPIKLSLTESIFLIQNYSQYNFFASEDGKVLFEKVKKEIEGQIVQNAPSMLEQKDKEAIKLLSEDRLRVLVKDNVEFEFNDDGNIVAFKNKDVEQEKAMAKSVKKIEEELEQKTIEKIMLNKIEDKKDMFTKEQEAKVENNKTPTALKEPEKKVEEEFFKSFLADENKEKDTQPLQQPVSKKTALEYKQEKQKKKALSKSIVKEIMSEEKFEELSNMDPMDFFPEELVGKKPKTNTKKKELKEALKNTETKQAEISKDSPEQNNKRSKQNPNTQVEKKNEKPQIPDQTSSEEEKIDKRLELCFKILEHQDYTEEYIKLDETNESIFVRTNFLFKVFRAKDFQTFEYVLRNYKKTLLDISGKSALIEHGDHIELKLDKKDFKTLKDKLEK